MAGHPVSEQEREAQKQYWVEHSTNATVETMMLDSKAADIDKMERPEVLGLLGSVEGKRVVELGAGIGRFTAPLAATAKSVLALDFMQNLIDENQATNGHLPNVEFRCADATELDLPVGSVDVLFSNWLLMYLSDAEVASLAARALRWLAPGGVVFFRESCFRQSGDRARAANPSHYRSPREYFAIFDAARRSAAGGDAPGEEDAQFELVVCKCIDTYVRVKQNQNQVCWKWAMVPCPVASPRVDRHFLDGNQYSERSIARYEWVFGQGFMSPGGAATAAEFAERLRLGAEAAVLDVGCGTGGVALALARAYGAYVHGIDLSVNAVLVALERAAATGNGDRVSFEISDGTKRELEPAAWDAVISRDAFLHVEDKAALLARLARALRPGGQLLFTDYCAPAGDLPDDLASHAARRGYSLLRVPDYAALLAAQGLEIVAAEDQSPRLSACLRAELDALRAGCDRFEAAFSRAEHEAMVASWEAKLARVSAGAQCWGLFHARKPQA